MSREYCSATSKATGERCRRFALRAGGGLCYGHRKLADGGKTIEHSDDKPLDDSDRQCSYIDTVGKRCKAFGLRAEGPKTRCAKHRSRTGRVGCEKPGCSKWRLITSKTPFCTAHAVANRCYGQRAKEAVKTAAETLPATYKQTCPARS